MRGKILLVRHMPNARVDRVARELAERDFELETVNVAEGQALPPQEAFDAAVIYGGAQMVEQASELNYLRDELKWIENWLRTDKPLLGICLGSQLLAHTLGGSVGPHKEGLSEIGFYPVTPTEAGRTLIPQDLMVYHWHLQGFEAPRSAELLATGQTFENQAFRYGRAYGLQFHPEITSDIQKSWLEEASHMLDHPGAHTREQQLADARRHLTGLGQWLAAFLDHWAPVPLRLSERVA
ncbi:MAG TPA: gamma-glutamyl-gamma-aminobutyrate hydrolase family protein [Kiloniellales bacterium]|nr:gamma-glutamyl-gamma-aminobutyrate hydrolase family protein [Kiloniellales bacterium]